MKLCSLALLSCVAYCQPPPRFEVATIRTAPPLNPDSPRVGMKEDGASVEYLYTTLTDLITKAYKVKAFQVTAPEWMKTERWDVQATLPEGARPAQVSEMLRALLEERFKLKIHFEDKEHSAYALVVDKGGPLLKEADPAASKSTGPRVGTPESVHFMFKAINMEDFAGMMSSLSDRPVVDATGLSGKYEIEMDVATKDVMGSRGSNIIMIGDPLSHGPAAPPASGSHALESVSDPGGSSLPAALKKLGLKLQPKKMAVQQIVVDSGERRPTDN